MTHCDPTGACRLDLRLLQHLGLLPVLEHADSDLARLRAILVLDEDSIAPAVLTVDPLDGDSDLGSPHLHVVAVKEDDRLVILQPRDFRGGVS